VFNLVAAPGLVVLGRLQGTNGFAVLGWLQSNLGFVVLGRSLGLNSGLLNHQFSLLLFDFHLLPHH
jgi:hypothetical protein